MAYSTTQIQAFRDELAALQEARTNLLAGRMASRVVIDGDVVEYHRVDVPILSRRIGELESILFEEDSPGDFATSFKISAGKGL